MSLLVGRWNVDLQAPMGVMDAVFTFRQVGEAIEGSMTMRGTSWTIDDVEVEHAADGERARWTMTIQEPMRATVKFDVTVDSDVMTGQGRLNLLMRAQVSGRRA